MYPIYDGLTKADLVELRGMENASFDYALPQEWVYSVLEFCKLNQLPFSYREIIFGFVWLYDEKSKVFGRPYPLTYTAHYLLTKLPPQLYGGT